MNGPDFCKWCETNGLNQPRACSHFGVSPSTIQRWRKNGLDAIAYNHLRVQGKFTPFASPANIPAKSPGRPGKLLEVPMRTRQGKQIFTEAEFATLTERWILPEGATDWHYSALVRYGRKSGWIPRYWPDSHERVTLLDSPALTDEDFASVIAEWDALKAAKPLHPNYNAELARINAIEGKAWAEREDEI